jgi:hypothetical protein
VSNEEDHDYFVSNSSIIEGAWKLRETTVDQQIFDMIRNLLWEVLDTVYFLLFQYAQSFNQANYMFCSRFRVLKD